MATLKLKEKSTLSDYSKLWVDLWDYAHSSGLNKKAKDFIDAVRTQTNNPLLNQFRGYEDSTLRTKFGAVKKILPQDLDEKSKLTVSILFH